MNRTLPERLDDLARLTGMPALSARMASGKQRRHLRWLPIILLLLVSSGMVVILARPNHQWPGYWALVFGNVIGGYLPIFGPIKPWGEHKGADERERQVRRDAYFAAFATISFVAVVGLLLLIGLTLLNRWKIDTLIFDLAMFTFFLILLWEIIPTLHASWATRPLEGE
jgi:asparagine N-glycosylation enzyme membrane subunit Stt3